MLSDGAQLGCQLLDVAVLGDPAESLLEVSFGLGPEAHLKVEPGRFPVNGTVLRIELQRGFHGLHARRALPGIRLQTRAR